MSGWTSKREAEQVIRATIVMNAADLPSGDPGDYWFARLFDDLVRPRSGGGWGMVEYDHDFFIATTTKHLRPKARRRIEMEAMLR